MRTADMPNATRAGTPAPDTRVAVVTTLCFLVVVTFSGWHHELWRDEMQAWLLARDSAGIVDLLAHLRYEAHPGLYHALLMVGSRISLSPVMMQVLNAVLSVASVFLIVRYAPLPRVHRVLLAFGYFFVYEYGTLSRAYTLGVFLLLVLCVLFAQRHVRFLTVAAVVFLLAQTSVPGLIMAGAFGGALLTNLLLEYRAAHDVDLPSAGTLLAGFTIMGLGAAAVLWQLRFPADSALTATPPVHFDAVKLYEVLRGAGRALFPVPSPHLDFWGRSWIEDIPNAARLQTALACVLLLLFAARLWRTPAAFVLFTLGSFVLLAAFYVEQFGSIRHYGHVLLLALAAEWIRPACQPLPFARTASMEPGQSRVFGTLLTGVLLIHVLGGVIAIDTDRRVVFSQGKAAAEFIEARGLQHSPIVGETDYAASTVVGYLQARAMYYPRGHRWGSFVIWDKARLDTVTDAQAVAAARQIADSTQQAVVLLLNHSIGNEYVNEGKVSPLTSLTGATLGDEGYHVYLLQASINR